MMRTKIICIYSTEHQQLFDGNRPEEDESSKIVYGIKISNFHQHTGSEDDIKDDSSNKSYTGWDINANGSNDSNDVLLSVLQQHKEKMKRIMAQKKE